MKLPMHLLNGGRKPFLEFLRNFTSQALILGIALVAGRGLEFTCCDFENTKQTILFWILFSIFLSAWVASSLQFIHDYLTPDERSRHGRAYRRLRGPRHSIKLMVTYTWRRNKALFYETSIVMLLIQMSFVIVLIHGIFIASGFMNIILGK